MQFLRLLLWTSVCVIASAQSSPDVGSGSPSADVKLEFQVAFYRNGFAQLVALPPVGDMKRFGTAGYVQEFQDAAKTANARYALVKPGLTTGGASKGVLQVYPAIYAYYNQIGVNTAGYPTTDTLLCPPLKSEPSNSCQYQLFDKPYALFVYSTATSNGSTSYFVRDPFYGKWAALGAIGGPGPATSAELTLTSAAGNTATYQVYDQGAIFNFTNGNLNGRLIGVGPSVYALYANLGGPAGTLGFPTSEEYSLPTGRRRQSFENGAVEYDPGSAAVFKPPINDIEFSPQVNGPIRLKLGDAITLQATPYAPNGTPLTDRTVIWTTSNSRVITIQSSGQSAAIKATGGGSATVTVSSEGKSSRPISIFVTAPCCGLGEGAPSGVQQAFQDAAARDQLTPRLPAESAARRTGNGYIQELQDAGTGAVYWIAVPDRTPSGYVLAGALLKKYQDVGGPASSLGYPVSDASPGGTQLFENGAALAGNPVQVVGAPFLSKWAALGYETGPAGPPVSDQSTVLSFRGTTARVQSFQNGILVAVQAGPTGGNVYLVSGTILAKYVDSGGPTGALGLPAGDESSNGNARRQAFEGGYVEYVPGGTAQAMLADRQPLVTVFPNPALAGSKIHLAVGGFAPGASVRVSISNQPDFTVTADAGAYAWDAIVPANSGRVEIRAVDTNTGASAQGSYVIRTLADISLAVTKVRGDAQSGPPRAVLPQGLRIAVKDESGNAVVGVPVHFSASPGAEVSPAAAVTDANGEAETLLRLPSNPGVALADAQAGRHVVTFSASVTASPVGAFPVLTQNFNVPLGNGTDTIAQNGSFLASVASILRYYQDRGALPAPNGFADPQILNQFLTNACTFDLQGNALCDGFVSPADSSEQIVNLWRLAAFTGGNLDVSIVKPDLAAVRDLVAQGNPVLLTLALQPQASGFVVASGVNPDGSIRIADPTYSRTNLNEYLNGFQAGGAAISGQLTGAVLLLPRASTAPGGFVLSGKAAFAVFSAGGPCGNPLEIPLKGTGRLRQIVCDGRSDTYQLDVSGDGPFRISLTELRQGGSRLDLAGSGAVSFAITRSGSQWAAAPEQVAFTAQSVVNAASFTSELAPGGIFSVFGAGLAGPGTPTTVQINGENAPVFVAAPFQLNAEVPPGLAPGVYNLNITSAYGTRQSMVEIRALAPAIFSAGAGAAILNQNGALNTPDNPAKRGEAIVVFATGLGMVQPQGKFQVVTSPVTAVIGGTELPAAFAGLAPGFAGLYQINVLLPRALPPGLHQRLVLHQGNASSNTVEVAIQ